MIRRSRAVSYAACLALALLTMGQVNMPDPRQMSGVPLPASDVPAGTISVRVIRGSFDHSLSGVDVRFSVDGDTHVVKTDDQGRAQIANLKTGARVTASATVDGEILNSQEVTVSTSGVRMVLVATDPAMAARAAEDKRLAAGPAVRGVVVLGPESRVVVQPAEGALSVFYVLDIENSARTPVDIGGPIVVNLPDDARGAAILDPAPPQAKALGSHVTVTGPFPPGATNVQIGFDIPYSTGTASLQQTFPLALPSVTFLMARQGHVDVASPQLTGRSDTVDDGRTVLVAQGPALAAGQPLSLTFTGLPHLPLWPRYTALAIAIAIVAVGFWAAFRRPAPVPAAAARAALRGERDRLLDRLATLERQHRSGKVSDAAYATARESLVATLEQIYADLDGSAAA